MSRRRVTRLLVSPTALAVALLASTAAFAGQSTVKAQFDVRLGPMQIGRGNFEAQITDHAYAVGVSARVTGVARLLAGGEGSATSQGGIHGPELVPTLYHISNSAGSASNEIRLLMKHHDVVNEMVIPPSYPFPDRVPLTDANRHGIIDPLSAFVFPVEGTGELLAPENCNRTLKVFDGRQRYDIQLSFDHLEQVSVKGDYEGQALVCKATYKPIAGYRRLPADGDAAAAYHDMSASLMPIPGTRALVLYRMQIGTPVGTLTAQATRISIQPGQQAASRD